MNHNELTLTRSSSVFWKFIRYNIKKYALHIYDLNGNYLVVMRQKKFIDSNYFFNMFKNTVLRTSNIDGANDENYIGVFDSNGQWLYNKETCTYILVQENFLRLKIYDFFRQGVNHLISFIDFDIDIIYLQ